MSDLQRKIDFAIMLLQSIPQDDGPIEVSYSGGKDSDVILQLAKEAGIPFEAIYKQTSIDPPGTTAHAKAMGATIIRPKRTMFQIIADHGWPTRRARFCCQILKEYKVHNRAVQGIRRSESTARAKRYKEPEYCRLYPHKEKVRVYLPILEWTDDDVAAFIQDRAITCAPIYYDNPGGGFDVKKRLGCLGCPMKSDCGKADFQHYPKLLKEWIRAGKKYIDNHPESGAARKFGNAYNMAFHNLFNDSYEEYETMVTGGLFPETAIDAKAFLEDYFKIDLTL